MAIRDQGFQGEIVDIRPLNLQKFLCDVIHLNNPVFRVKKNYPGRNFIEDTAIDNRSQGIEAIFYQGKGACNGGDDQAEWNQVDKSERTDIAKI